MSAGDGDGQMVAPLDIARLVAARKLQRSDSYDEAFHEVAARIGHAGSVGKADIGALLFWKRLRADTPWAAALNQVIESEVRQITARAVQAARDDTITTAEAASAARNALTPLPGFTTGDALASAVIAASAPRRMAVYDRRAHAALRKLLGRDIGHRPGRYRRYMTEIVGVLEAVRVHNPGWTARDVDVALFRLGGQEDGS